MAVVGTNNFIDRELTQQEFSDRGFPAFYVLKNEAKQIIKFIAFDAAGDRSDVYFDPTVILYATQDDLNAEIVNRAIADQNLQNQVNTINSQKSAVVDKMLHYWDATLGKWLSSGIAFVSGKFGVNTNSPAELFDVVGRVKANSFVLASPIATAIPWEFGRQSGEPIIADASGVPMKILLLGKTFEHQIKGKRVEITSSSTAGGTINIDLEAGNHFAITLLANSNLAFVNMIASSETTVRTIYVTGAFLETLPAGAIGDPYNDAADLSKKRKYTFHIERGGVSPIISYTLVNA